MTYAIIPFEKKEETNNFIKFMKTKFYKNSQRIYLLIPGTIQSRTCGHAKF